MSIFFAKILPLYGLIILGLILKRTLDLDLKTVARLLIYFFAPVTFGAAIMSPDFDPRMLFLILFMLLFSSLVAALSFNLARAWPSVTGIVAFASSAGNTGYFGIPVILALWGSAALPAAVAIAMGTVLFEVTAGFYMMARQQFSPRKSLQKALHLPSIYAFSLGLIFHFAGFSLQGDLAALVDNFKGAYGILGMLLIGLALGEISLQRIKARYLWRGILLAFSARFIIWPLLALGTVSLMHAGGIYWPQIERVWLIIAAVPIAANTVAYASTLKLPSDFAAILVVGSTFWSMLWLPLWAYLLKLGGWI